ncbi:hypothetical protein UFOVP331_26 [uncultured Caudovirales phage]|uniref:Uncharacterized protein n=1 Tax=uncultured Caudovirales phage TaxID=2100421 RepID=A0A6J5LZX3_9CAUD|nr:hypothetical protein UFOVP331_26 [uncultured Caudovirales phage]
MRKLQLRQLIKEELSRYMFFQNLKSIKMMVDEMLEMDEKMVNDVLLDGHSWAEDHITTSKDDIEEVHNFLTARLTPVANDEKEPKYKEGDVIGYGGSQYVVLSDDGFVVKAKRKKDGYQIMLNYAQLADARKIEQ